MKAAIGSCEYDTSNSDTIIMTNSSQHMIKVVITKDPLDMVTKVHPTKVINQQGDWKCGDSSTPSSIRGSVPNN
jgi:hypothetical protein